MHTAAPRFFKEVFDLKRAVFEAVGSMAVYVHAVIRYPLIVGVSVSVRIHHRGAENAAFR